MPNYKEKKTVADYNNKHKELHHFSAVSHSSRTAATTQLDNKSRQGRTTDQLFWLEL